MADFRNKGKTKLWDMFDERKTQQKWRTLAKERRNQNGGLPKRSDNHKIWEGLDERKKQPNGGLRLKEDTTKNKVDFSERKTQPKWQTFETKEKPNYGLGLTKERRNQNGGLPKRSDNQKNMRRTWQRKDMIKIRRTWRKRNTTKWRTCGQLLFGLMLSSWLPFWFPPRLLFRENLKINPCCLTDTLFTLLITLEWCQWIWSNRWYRILAGFNSFRNLLSFFDGVVDGSFAIGLIDDLTIADYTTNDRFSASGGQWW